MLRGMSEDQLLQMRLQTQFLWDAYFSSVETIVYTTLEVSLACVTVCICGHVTLFWLVCAFPLTQFILITFVLQLPIDMFLLQIIRQRIKPHLSNGRTVWNTSPGGLVTRAEFSTYMADFPFYLNPMERVPGQGYTAVIKATNPPESSLLVKLIKSIALAPRLKKVFSTSYHKRWLPHVTTATI